MSDSPEPWWRCRGYLRGLDLFNHGDYWEAHEAWEAVWHVAGRQGPTAALLKGLIKLAAAGVKTRAGSWSGRRRHCRRAVDLFRRLAEREAPPDTPGGWLGLSPTGLAQRAAEAAEEAPFASPAADPQVFRFRLVPGDSAP
jgi:predicted metal-dependent hydrolase